MKRRLREMAVFTFQHCKNKSQLLMERQTRGACCSAKHDSTWPLISQNDWSFHRDLTWLSDSWLADRCCRRVCYDLPKPRRAEEQQQTSHRLPEVNVQLVLPTERLALPAAWLLINKRQRTRIYVKAQRERCTRKAIQRTLEVLTNDLTPI